jgi:dephospho-CoA kinase
VKPFVLGITGCVGAGKSTVCQWLNAQGWSVLDVDAVARQCLRQEHRQVAQLIPQAIDPNETLPVPLLMQLMFQNENLKLSLETLLVPLVKKEINSWIAGLSGPGVLDSALLFEFSLQTLCDATLTATCPMEVRRARVLKRSGASAILFDEIEKAQWSEKSKIEASDFCLSTEGTIEETQKALDAILNLIGIFP